MLRRATLEDYERRVLRVQQIIAGRLDETILPAELARESHEAFTRAFIERFGLSPSEYRDTPSARSSEWERQH